MNWAINCTLPRLEREGPWSRDVGGSEPMNQTEAGVAVQKVPSKQGRGCRERKGATQKKKELWIGYPSREGRISLGGGD